MNAKKFLEAIRSQQGNESSVDKLLTRQRDEWIDDLNALRASIRKWMDPIAKAGVAKLKDTDFEMTDPDLGTYMAPGLEIVLIVDTDRHVRVRPRGLQVVGIVEPATGKRVRPGAEERMKGRIDLECGVKREILARIQKKGANAWSWYSFAGGKERALDEDLFFELLARTADVALR